jgi:large repetitive protein
VLGGGDNGFVDNLWWYFGIRRYPYSTDMTKDPLTYKHITNGVALPTTAPIAYPDDGSRNAEVHNTGEVWTTMLWECYAALLRDTGRLTFDQARDRMRAYLVASLKLTPADPTLLEARDALLAVAFAADRDDHALFVRAFAKRGAGPRAVASPDRFTSTNDGVVESFDVGGDLGLVSATLDDSAAPCDRDGRLDAGETGTLTLSLRNRGLSRLSATQLTISSPNPAVSFPAGATASVPTTDPTQATSLSLPVKLAAGTTGVQNLGFSLTLRDPGMFADATSSLTFRGNVDDAPGTSTSDDVESALSPWRPASAAGFDPSALFRRIEVTPFDHRWSSHANVDFPADLTLTSPPLVFAASGPLTATFRHRYSFMAGAFFTTATDYLDGGVVELSADGGATWGLTDATLSSPYTQTLWNGSSARNPLKGLKAWAGDSPGLPGFTTVTVTFGSSWNGKTALMRFRRGMEGDFPENFWEIDDIALTGITNTPFPALVADRGRCRGRTIPVGSPPGGTSVRKR